MTSHKTSKLLYHIKAYQLMVFGLILIIVSLVLHHEVHIDSHLYELFVKLVGEVGGLFLVVSVLHWMFEHGVRQEMLKEISEFVLGNERLRKSGLIDFQQDSSLVDKSSEENNHWQNAEKFIICAHYPEEFFREEIAVIRHRCESKKETVILLLDPNSPGAQYQQTIDGNEIPDIADKIQRIENLLTNPKHIGNYQGYVKVLKHPQILRYSLILTEEYAWVNFYTNSNYLTVVPALKVQEGTLFYQFLIDDLDKLINQSH
jgi:hypothetical protein